jgi:hypothetical protein
MHKSATKCNETIGKWCKNKHGASKIIDTFETYHRLQTAAPQRPPRWMTHCRGASETTPRGHRRARRSWVGAARQSQPTRPPPTASPPRCHLTAEFFPPATTAGQRRSDDKTTERRREHQLLIQRAVAPGSSSAPAIGAKHRRPGSQTGSGS